MSIDQTTLFTPDDLLTMPDGDRYELVDGHLLERNLGSWAGFVAGNLLGQLGQFVRSRRMGLTLGPRVSYQCFAGHSVRKPRVSFIRTGRLPVDRIPDGHLLIAPDFVAETVAPADRQYDVDRKVVEYLAACHSSG